MLIPISASKYAPPRVETYRGEERVSIALDENSVLGRKHIDHLALAAAVCLSACTGFFLYSLARVHGFSIHFSWPLFWRSVAWTPILGVVPVAGGIGAVLLWRVVLRTRVAAARIAKGTCPLCSYKIGVPGLARCPECGYLITKSARGRLTPIGFRRVAVVALVIVIAHVTGAMISDGLIRLDERAFLSEVAARQLSSRPNAIYHRARAEPFSHYGMTYISGRVALTD